MKLNFTIVCLLFSITNIYSQWKQNDFMIGIYSPPESYPVIIGVPSDYDGDGKSDVAIKISSGSNAGQWRIDYAVNGFSTTEWDYISLKGLYGGTEAIPAPADYDGDGKSDISVKFNDGIWKIDYANNGFGSWDWSGISYGGSNAIPVPADYDGDGKVDISVKVVDDDRWIIDYASDGFGGWNWMKDIYGLSDAVPVPADYDGDGKSDISVKFNDGTWKVDYAKNGFGSWDLSSSIYGGAEALASPGDYDGDGKTDLSVLHVSGDDVSKWKIDYAINGFGSFDKTLTGYGGNPVSADYNGDGFTDISSKLEDGRWLIDYGLNGWNKVWTDSNGETDYSCNASKIDGESNINDIYARDLISLNKIKSCNIDLLIDPHIFDYESTFRQKDYYLALVEKTGLSVMLKDHSMHSFPVLETNGRKEVFLNHFKNDIPDYLKEHIYCVNFGDEPIPDQLTNVNDWSIFFKNNYPEKPIFCNLLARYALDYFGSDLNDNSAYEEYLNSFSNALDIISYDHYPFYKDGFRDSYFYNLKIVKEKANNKPFWATIASREWENGLGVLDPMEEHLRFMAFCPIAYGAKGLMYWTYIDAFETNNIKYDWIKNINQYLKNIVAPVIMFSTNTASLHKTNTSLNASYPFVNNELLLYNNGVVKDVDKTDALIGTFDYSYFVASDKTYINAGSSYIWVVNKNVTTTLNNVNVTLRGNYLNKAWISPRVIGYQSNPSSNYFAITNLNYASTNNTTSATIPELYPGEGIMLKINSGSKPVPSDYDGDGIADFSIKTDSGKWEIDYSSNGFGSLDWIGQGYGGVDAIPVPADYDGDDKSDISVKFNDGTWKIDYANNGFNGWDWSGISYGGSNAIPVPADYDGDGKVDISVKVVDDGRWIIDYASDGFGGWNWMKDIYGLADAVPVPADYDGDGKSDISVKLNDGTWKIDYAKNGFGSWDIIDLLPTNTSKLKNGIILNPQALIQKDPISRISSNQVYENLSVFDLNGRLLKKFSNVSINQVNELPNGLYIIKIIQGTNLISEKVFINN